MASRLDPWAHMQVLSLLTRSSRSRNALRVLLRSWTTRRAPVARGRRPFRRAGVPLLFIPSVLPTR
jgi:hypothetical protein